jgi:hypothetical protein
MTIKQRKNKATILSEETIPNSLRISLLVIINVAKPAAVVRLVIKVAVPTLVITVQCFSFVSVSTIFLLVFIC